MQNVGICGLQHTTAQFSAETGRAPSVLGEDSEKNEWKMLAFVACSIPQRSFQQRRTHPVCTERRQGKKGMENVGILAPQGIVVARMNWKTQGFRLSFDLFFDLNKVYVFALVAFEYFASLICGARFAFVGLRLRVGLSPALWIAH
jgi:hypothetical protein